jgi:hypothetical protein
MHRNVGHVYSSMTLRAATPAKDLISRLSLKRQGTCICRIPLATHAESSCGGFAPCASQDPSPPPYC